MERPAHELRAPKADPLALAADPAPLAGAARKNLLQLVQLRWIAMAGQMATIGGVEWGMQIHLPLFEMGVVLAVFLAGNIGSLLRLRRPSRVSNLELFFT